MPEAVAPAVIDDLRDRLERTRLPNAIDGIGWEQGTDLDYLAGLLEHWRDGYDWRRCEQELAAHDEHTIDIDGQRIHALVARSPNPDALPLLLVHGWPGSVVEFLDAVGPLTDPAAHGADAGDAFHVVAPALPGFGFSGPTLEQGWHPRRIAAAFVELMADLGFDRFGAQGGDWGSVVTANVADLVPERVAGLHLNFVAVPPPKDGPPLTDAEQADFARLVEWRKRRRADGHRQLPGRDHEGPARLGGTALPRRPLDRATARWALRRDGGAGPVRRRRPDVLPASASAIVRQR